MYTYFHGQGSDLNQSNHLGSRLSFRCGVTMPNRFMLAPMTNCQSFKDGSLSEAEYLWLVKRAIGHFGMVMTCAAHVQTIGQGFPGQLGIYSDALLDGHRRLAGGIREHGSVAVIQLHHAGRRALVDAIEGVPVCPSRDESTGARALTLSEIDSLCADFVKAALRAQSAGYDGVEIHGAHDYLLCQFLSAKYNHRTDEFGGSVTNRMRLISNILDGIRQVCGSQFLLGLRLSPEKYGIELSESIEVFRRLAETQTLDFLDVSLWDYKKKSDAQPDDERGLLDVFSLLERGQTKLTVAGKIQTASDVADVVARGVDFVGVGRAGILHHDFPALVMTDPNFRPRALPVSRDVLAREGVSPVFADYLTRWPGFVAD
ncbi:MAG: NADH:flavin oxidoreductase [Myxococcales bacterium]|nr:NADH:flavin oxidoreductase [Myxococcales bacterium]